MDVTPDAIRSHMVRHQAIMGTLHEEREYRKDLSGQPRDDQLQDENTRLIRPTATKRKLVESNILSVRDGKRAKISAPDSVVDENDVDIFDFRGSPSLSSSTPRRNEPVHRIQPPNTNLPQLHIVRSRYRTRSGLSAFHGTQATSREKERQLKGKRSIESDSDESWNNEVESESLEEPGGEKRGNPGFHMQGSLSPLEEEDGEIWGSGNIQIPHGSGPCKGEIDNDEQGGDDAQEEQEEEEQHKQIWRSLTALLASETRRDSQEEAERKKRACSEFIRLTDVNIIGKKVSGGVAAPEDVPEMRGIENSKLSTGLGRNRLATGFSPRKSGAKGSQDDSSKKTPPAGFSGSSRREKRAEIELIVISDDSEVDEDPSTKAEKQAKREERKMELQKRRKSLSKKKKGKQRIKEEQQLPEKVTTKPARTETHPKVKKNFKARTPEQGESSRQPLAPSSKRLKQNRSQSYSWPPDFRVDSSDGTNADDSDPEERTSLYLRSFQGSSPEL